jgi:serine protease Do
MNRTSVLSLPLLAASTLAWLPLATAQLNEKPAPPPAGMALAKQLNEAYVSVFERVAPAVVVIDVTKKTSEGGVNPMDFFGDYFGRGPGGDDEQDGTPAPSPRGRQPQPPNRRAPRAQPQPQSEGSGFIIKSDGYILTNAHVVNGADKINVRIKDGRNLAAKLIGIDEKTDIAIIKVDATNLPVAALANSDAVRVGEIVFAIGAPYNLDYTFTAGIVSAKGRNRLNVTPDGYEDFIQTDASINPGNSGGPLVNLDGQVIGMNTLINGINRGLGFAIPANMMRDIGGQLMDGGRVVRPYLGIRIESYEDYAKRADSFKFDNVKSGVVVVTIEPDTPAANSDLRPADVITQVDGKEVRTADELRKLVLTKKVGAKVDLSVVRKGKPMQVAVTTAELPGERPIRAANVNPRERQKTPGEEERASFLGVEVQTLTKELASNLGVKEDRGVVVTAVKDGSLASEAQLRVKDVITEVGDKAITDVASFKEAVKSADPKKGVLLYVQRPGKTGGGKTFVVIKDGEK